MPRVALSNRTAITLVELLVVLVVLGLASALVAPALIFPEPAEPGRYNAALRGGVELAAAREEIVRLVVGEDGGWRILSSTAQRLSDGRFEAYPGPRFVLSISPLGTCGPEPGSSPPFELDPLTCTAP